MNSNDNEPARPSRKALRIRKLVILGVAIVCGYVLGFAPSLLGMNENDVGYIGVAVLVLLVWFGVPYAFGADQE